MKIEAIKADQAVLLVLGGDLASREDQRALTDLVSEKLADSERLFVIDMSGVSYVSSLGIAALVATYVKVNREGGALRLVNPRPRVATVLQMTKVSDMFKTYTTVAEALVTS